MSVGFEFGSSLKLLSELKLNSFNYCMVLFWKLGISCLLAFEIQDTEYLFFELPDSFHYVA